MTSKPRILHIAWTLPGPNGGACLALQRHFLERTDFELAYLSNSLPKIELKRFTLVQSSPLLRRLQNTRLRRLFRQFDQVLLARSVLPAALDLIDSFKPDLLFTVPDNDLSWTAYLASQKTGLPLVTDFQDWWPHNQYWDESERPYPVVVRPLLERRFRTMYRRSSIAFCTSDGMREFLGEHPCAPTLYPCPPKLQVAAHTRTKGSRLRIVYAGTALAEYGNMLWSLCPALKDHPRLCLEIYGPANEKDPQVSAAREAGIYKGLLPHADLMKVLAEADAFLSLMCFSEKTQIMSRVSFTTKVLEYAQFSKPIVVWGPSFCQPVVVAKREKCALPVDEPKPAALVHALESLHEEARYADLARGARQAAAGLFNPDKIHALFRDSILQLLTEQTGRQSP